MLRTVALVAAVAVSTTVAAPSVAANYDQQALVYFNETMGLDVEAILVKVEKKAEAYFSSGRKLSKQRRQLSHYFPEPPFTLDSSLANYRRFQSKGDHGYGCYPYQEGIGATALGQNGEESYVAFVNEYWNYVILYGLFGSAANFEAILQDFNTGAYNLKKAVDVANNVQCGIFHNLFTRFRARGLINKDAVPDLPAYNSEATLCQVSHRQHQGALWDSLTVGTFGSQESTERTGWSLDLANVKDCSARCVYDVRNPKNHFRWNKEEICYNFNENQKCKDADSDEEDFAAQVAKNVCTEQDNPGSNAHFIAQLKDGSYSPIFEDAGPAVPSTVSPTPSPTTTAPTPNPTPSPTTTAPTPKTGTLIECTSCLEECNDDCLNTKNYCTEGKKCRKTFKQCKKTCKAIWEECRPPCEDNSIPGLGTYWCKLNTHYATQGAKERFCANELYKSKCQMSCGEC